LYQNAINDKVLYDSAIYNATACPFCSLINIYDIASRNKVKGRGLVVRSIGNRGGGSQRFLIENNYWFSADDTTFDRFATLTLACVFSADEYYADPEHFDSLVFDVGFDFRVN